MHFVIIDERTNWFVTTEGTFTTVADEAGQFSSLSEALSFTRGNYLGHCGIYARHTDGSLTDAMLVATTA